MIGRKTVDLTAADKITAYAQDFSSGKMRDLLMALANRTRKMSIEVSIFASTSLETSVGLEPLVRQHLKQAGILP